MFFMLWLTQGCAMTDAVQTPAVGRSLWADAWARLRTNKAATISSVYLMFIAVVCIIGPMLTPNDFSTIHQKPAKLESPRAYSGALPALHDDRNFTDGKFEPVKPGERDADCNAELRTRSQAHVFGNGPGNGELEIVRKIESAAQRVREQFRTRRLRPFYRV